jgi:hypothetical protein
MGGPHVGRRTKNDGVGFSQTSHDVVVLPASIGLQLTGCDLDQFGPGARESIGALLDVLGYGAGMSVTR